MKTSEEILANLLEIEALHCSARAAWIKKDPKLISACLLRANQMSNEIINHCVAPDLGFFVAKK